MAMLPRPDLGRLTASCRRRALGILHRQVRHPWPWTAHHDRILRQTLARLARDLPDGHPDRARIHAVLADQQAQGPVLAKDAACRP